MQLAYGDVVEQISEAIKIPGRSGADTFRIKIQDAHGNVGWTTLHANSLEKVLVAASTNT